MLQGLGTAIKDMHNAIMIEMPCLFIITITIVIIILNIEGHSGANDATRTTNKQYAIQTSCYCSMMMIIVVVFDDDVGDDP